MESNITEHTQKSLLDANFTTPEYYSTPKWVKYHTTDQ